MSADFPLCTRCQLKAAGSKVVIRRHVLLIAGVQHYQHTKEQDRTMCGIIIVGSTADS